MARVMETLSENEFTTQLTLRLKGQRKRTISILDLLQTCPTYRESQLSIGWDEAFCTHYDKLSNEDHTYVCNAEEHTRLETS